MSAQKLQAVFDLEKDIAALQAKLEAAKAELDPDLRVRLFGVGKSRDTCPKVAIEAIDQQTGLVVHTFESGRAAEALGFSASAISACLNGRGRSHRNLFWRRRGDNTMPEIKPPTDLTSYLDRFCAERLHEAPGHLIPYGDFYDRFKAWLPDDEREKWSRVKVTYNLPGKFQSGTFSQNKTYIINASWEPVEPLAPYVVSAGRVRRTEPLRLPRRVRVPVEAVDPESGNVIHTFSSIMATANGGFSPQMVSNTVNGKQTTYCGFIWRRAKLGDSSES